MQECDILNRIQFLCRARNWTLYRLAKESDITYSTLCTMLRKGNTPSIPTLIKLCNGFDISLGEFFDYKNDSAALTHSQKTLLEQWDRLSKADRQTAERFITFLLSADKYQEHV